MPDVHIIKIGGKIIGDPILMDHFIDAFVAIKGFKVLVHGGGKKASEIMNKMHIPVKMYEGRRITDAETLEITTMVYAGLLNKQITADLQKKGVDSIGLTGADLNLIRSKKRPVGEIDFGFVGDIEEVDGQKIQALLDLGMTPVFCAITHDLQGQLLNTNADTVASKIAIELSKTFNTHLSYCFEFQGVIDGSSSPSRLIPTIKLEQFEELKQQGIIKDGMIPKVFNALTSSKNGVKYVYIRGIQELISNTGTRLI